MEIRKNLVKEKLAAGGVACVVTGLNSSEDIDAFGLSGFDGIWLEGEHGGVGPADLGDLTRACDIWGMTSIVRLNRNDQGLIYRTLDRGAQGIVIPHVNTASEARNIVDGAKFAPIGHRGLYTGRQGYGVSDYVKVANEETLLVALVEDIASVRALDEILAVEHIDVFFVAPADLAASMGHIGDHTHPEVQEVIDTTMGRIRDAGRVAGAIGSADTVEHQVAAGARFLLTGVNAWIAAGAADYLRRVAQG
jgi:4-hydroxy-2-oxoheptanedioate aldolase